MPKAILLSALCLFILGACGKDPIDTEHESPTLSIESGIPIPLNGSALWLELGEEGLNLLDRVEDSELVPFTPWPLARRICSILPKQGTLICAVNRYGFLLAEQEEDNSLRLRWIRMRNLVEPFSMGSLFRYGNRVAINIYRDAFFTEPPIDGPSDAIVYLDADHSSWGGINPPFLSGIEAATSVDLDTLALGKDDRWYFRVSNPLTRQTEHYVTESLDTPALPSSPSEFRDARGPILAYQAPKPMDDILVWLSENIQEDQLLLVNLTGIALESDRTYLVSLDTVDMKLFSSGSGDFSEAYGFVDSHRAFLIFPDGRGIQADRESFPVSFFLPQLPQGFMYTGVAALGDYLICPWEEQENWAVGSAGVACFPIP